MLLNQQSLGFVRLSKYEVIMTMNRPKVVSHERGVHMQNMESLPQ